MSPLPARRVAGRYDLRGLLGRGGTGAVWLAEDAVLGREVAVKEVALPATLPEAEREAVRRRVMREARAAARLSHPGVVTVYDVVSEGQTAFLVMELVRAPNLAELVERDGPLPPARAAGLGVQVLAALRALHDAGIVHRDVKPGNVMVRPGDLAVLTDFGIARLAGDPRVTQTGMLVGSPAYMAPEQALGEEVDARADLWGLGATLYHAVEGGPPFGLGEPLPTLHAVVHDDPAAATRSGPLGPVLAGLLAKDPADRPRPDPLHAQLVAVRDGAAHAAEDAALPRPPSALSHEERQASRPVQAPAAQVGGRRRAPLAGLTAGVAALVLAGAGVVATVTGDRADAPPDDRAPVVASEPQDPQEGEAAAVPQAPGSTPETSPEPTPEPTEDRASEPAVGPTSGADADPTPTQRATSAPLVPPPDESPSETQEGSFPTDWVTYTDPDVGYQVAHPPDWEIVQVSDTLTDIRDPDGGRYLRLDWTDAPPPTPESSWQELSDGFTRTKRDYEEIRIDPTTFRTYDAALWEYRYAEGGTVLHAANLGIDTGPYGYALNFQTREPDWESSQNLYQSFQASFRPAQT